MKRILLSFFLLILAVFAANAQRIGDNRLELDLWHPGQITLRDGTFVKGNINFNYVINMIRVQNAGTVQTYNHKQLLDFTVFKEEENRNVSYKSLNLPIGDKIYEVVGEDDEKALLVANVIDQEAETEYTNLGFYNRRYSYSAIPPTPGTRGTRTQVVNRKAEAFFLITNTGKIHDLGKIVIIRNSRGQLKSTIKRKKLIAILKGFNPDIEQYLKVNKINLRKREQLIATILSVMN